MLGRGSGYVWGLSQVSVNGSVLGLSRMDNAAAVHSEWRCGPFHVGLTVSQTSQPCAIVSSPLSEGKFRYSS